MSKMYGFRTPFGGDSAALVVVLILLLTVTMASTGSGSYRIRSRPPNLGNKQQLSASSNRSQQQQQHWQDVYIAGFFALSDHEIEASLGLGVMPAINLALRHLANSTLLHDYRLRLLHNDTQCSASVGMKAFFDMMDKDPRKVMILGGSCTSVTDYIAKTSKHWRIPVLSYADTHPMFTKKSYPNFFRIVPSESAFNAPRVKLLKAFNWTRVGTLYQNEPRFALAHNGLVSLLDIANIELTESQGFVNDLSQPLAKLVEKDVRIILASFNATWARRVFCQVSRINLYGERYQWIIAGPRQERWWNEEDPSVNCTQAQILAALEGAFVVDVLPLTSSKQVTISGLTAQEYEAQYNAERGSEYSQFHGYAYDAIWTAAATVKNVVHKLHEHNKLVSAGGAGNSDLTAFGRSPSQQQTKQHLTIHDFIYRNAKWEELFLESLRSVNFNGVTGRIKFEDNERSGRLTVKQIIGAHEVSVAEYENASDTLFLNESAISWMSENKLPPRDRTIQIVEPSRISVPVFVTLTTVAALGIVLASSFLAVNIRFRNQRYIKMSSPYLNNTIIIGCLLTYTSVILLGLDSHLTSESALPVICTARIWTLMAGFTLAFGSMFSKTWRVHSIFTDVKLNKKAIKDYQLFMVVGVLLAIDIAILSTWQIIDPFYRDTKLLDPYMHPTDVNVEIRPQNEYCQSNHMTIFVGSIYAYKGLLMAFGCFLAWETRNVNIPALNDSKYIGMSVYNVVIMCVIGGAVSFILADEQDVSYVIISIFIIFCTTGTLCLVFVPKLIELKRNPEGTIEKRSRPTVKPQLTKAGGSGSGSTGGHRSAGHHRRENSLHHKNKARNAKLRKELRNLDDEIQKLLEQLGDDNDDSLAKEGPSFSYKIDSDCRVPSVSGADTMSLCSLISSPEPTSSPHHIKENGGKGIRAAIVSVVATGSGQQQQKLEQQQQQQQQHTSSKSSDGSASASVVATSAAMWSAISNPLLLINHVMRRSMDFQEGNSSNDVVAATDASIPPSCIVSVERHAEPRTNPHVNLGDTDESTSLCQEDAVIEVTHLSSSHQQLKDESFPANEPTVAPLANHQQGSYSNLFRSTSVQSSSDISRCACQHSSVSPGGSSTNTATNARRRRRRRTGRLAMMESLSMTEIRSPKHQQQLHLSEGVGRSLSVQGGMMVVSSPVDKVQYRSDSSFNYESNLSELDSQNNKRSLMSNCFEYRSLESINSAPTTISGGTVEEEEEEEVNSTQVNFDEGSTTFNSPKEELEVVDGMKSPSLPSVSDDPVLHQQHYRHLSLRLGNHDANKVNGAEFMTERPLTPSTTPVKTSGGGGIKQSGGRRKNQSQSTRERRKTRLVVHSGGGGKPAISHEDISDNNRIQRHSPPEDFLDHQSEWSILPIFKQLIVQKHLEQSSCTNGTQSQPIRIEDDGEESGSSSSRRRQTSQNQQGHRQMAMASCPNLSIKCDVVEYF